MLVKFCSYEKKVIFLCNTDCFISIPATNNSYPGGVSKDYDRLWSDKTSKVVEHYAILCEQGSNMSLDWINEPTEKE